jgi:hypothetical protein
MRLRNAVMGAAILGMALFAGSARADILITFAGISPSISNPGATTFTYDVFLNPGFELDKAGFKSNTATGDLFTLYDIGGFIPGSETSTGLVSTSFAPPTEQLLGITPATQTPPDSATVLNITFKYIHPTELNNPGGPGHFNLFLGTLSFDSTLSFVGTDNLAYSAATQKHNPGHADDESLANNTSFLPGPAVPEPATLILCGVAFPVIGAYWMRRRMSAAPVV